MNKNELKKLTHLSVNEEVAGKFYHIHVEDGFIATSWKEGDDIEDYIGFKCVYMPLAEEYMDLHIITDTEHAELNTKAEEARMAKREEERKSRVKGRYTKA